MNEIIKSTNNSLIKHIKKLSNKRNRKKHNQYIIESRKMIEEAIKSNQDIENIIIRDDVEDIFDKSTIVEKKLFNNLSNLSTPDGYMAIINKKIEDNLSDKILILDNLQDPGNLGTLIRSCEAFGFNTIISINSVDFYNEKVLRSTMGSIFRLNLIEEDYKFLDTLKDYNFYTADMSGKDYRKVNYSQKICLVIGNEGNGISQDIKNREYNTIKIPMQGDVESLNAAVSGSILMSYLGKE